MPPTTTLEVADAFSSDEPGSGGAVGATKPQRGRTLQRKRRSKKKRRRHSTTNARDRIDSLPRSRLQTRAPPATVAFKTFAAQSVIASAVAAGSDPSTHLYAADDEEPLEADSRIVSDAEVKSSMGTELPG